MEVGGPDGYWTISVEDAGVGFDPHQLDLSDPDVGGFGLSTLRVRQGLFDGELEIDAAPGRGTRVRVRLPVPAGGEGTARPRDGKAR